MSAITENTVRCDIKGCGHEGEPDTFTVLRFEQGAVKVCPGCKSALSLGTTETGQPARHRFGHSLHDGRGLGDLVPLAFEELLPEIDPARLFTFTEEWTGQPDYTVVLPAFPYSTTFTTVFTDHADRNGQPVTVTGRAMPPATDEGILMFEGRWSDGTPAIFHPEEVGFGSFITSAPVADTPTFTPVRISEWFIAAAVAYSEHAGEVASPNPIGAPVYQARRAFVQSYGEEPGGASDTLIEYARLLQESEPRFKDMPLPAIILMIAANALEFLGVESGASNRAVITACFGAGE